MSSRLAPSRRRSRCVVARAAGDPSRVWGPRRRGRWVLSLAEGLEQRALLAGASPSSVPFGDVPVNTTVTQVVTITVDAGYRTELASGSGINAPFGFEFDTCGTGGGFTGPGTCTVKQKFMPTSAATSSGTTNVFQCPVVGGSCIPIPYTVSGKGIVTADATPDPVAFGNVPINTTVTRDVTIKVDAGYRTELASGSGINSPFSFDFSTCGVGGGFTGPGTCTVKQKFTPTSATISNGTTNVFQCPVAGGSCIAIPYAVSGTGVVTADATPDPVAFGNVPINTTATRDVTITVDAGYRTELASGSGINSPFSFDFSTCGLGGGFTGPGTCTVKQKFTPTSATFSSGTTNVFQCPVAGGSCIAIPYAVSGTGVRMADATPDPVAFGNVPINTTVTRDVTITVDAGYRTEIASGTGINAPFGFSFDTCGAGGGFTGPGTCTVKQRFTPTSATISSGTTNVFQCPVAGGTCIPISFGVSGTGVSVASATPSPVAFGNVPINTTVTRDVTITVDAGYRTEIASGTGINAPFGFSFDTCGVGGGFTGPGTCTIKERFTPTAVGAASGTTNVFQCPVAGGSCIPISFGVSGTGVSMASASPATVAFGDVPINTTVTRDVTITVDAGYRTEIASGTGINAPFGFSFDTCGAGGGFTGPGTCTIKERFTPTSLSSSSGTTNVFQCPVAGGSCIPISFGVSGKGVSVASATPSPVAFGDVPVGTTATRDVTITADTGYRIEIASGSGINAPFGFSFDTCGTGGGFAGPGTCNVKETFHPTAVGPASGTTNVFECPIAGGSCIPIPFTVTGTGVLADVVAPSVVNFVRNAGLAMGDQNSMVKSIRVNFSEPVNAALLGPSAFTLLRAGLAVANVNLVVDVAADRRSATIIFTGSAVVGGSLADGRYTLRVDRARIRDDAGNFAAADGVYNFIRRFGDADSSGVTNNNATTPVGGVSDQTLFMAAYNSRVEQANYSELFDYNGDGVIDSRDYAQFILRINTTNF